MCGYTGWLSVILIIFILGWLSVILSFFLSLHVIGFRLF